MSSETFATAIFLITAIVAAAVLINAFFPIIYQASSTFSESSQSADERLRTEVKVINTYANSSSDPDAEVWIKNIGSARIAKNDIDVSDVFFGQEGDFEYLLLDISGTIDKGEWSYTVLEDTVNDYWDPRETLRIDINSNKIPDTSGQYVYFQFVLPSGVSVAKTFTTSG
ncbi:flagellin [Methanolacinia petrolearia DSM 11571]|uniref:Flagellin n=1 Tax=Methanolacinia petrolearia (strain DSM 11571 / OCM 486 / SEBR 4847) TaxID=679926 RepID=E1RJJ9_METP4|nr:flagellin [Methanolacinia petrolearia]ADN36805.1 flagellin [Methanolacinia petrolearia DSM 11571]